MKINRDTSYLLFRYLPKYPFCHNLREQIAFRQINTPYDRHHLGDLSFYEKTVLRIGLGDPDLPGENQECPFQAFESDQNIRIWNTADSYNSP